MTRVRECCVRPDSATAAENGDPSGPRFTGELPVPEFDQLDGQLDAVPGEPFAEFDRNPDFGSASTDSYGLLELAAGLEFEGFGARPMRVSLEVRKALDEPCRDFLNSYKACVLDPGRDLRATLGVPPG